MAQPLAKLERETTGLKLFPLLTPLGWASIMVAVLNQAIPLMAGK